MAHSVFGWSLPPGCTSLPGEDMPDWDWRYRCNHCGGFLPMKPDRSEEHEQNEHCNGQPIGADEGLLLNCPCGEWKQHEPHDFTVHSWTVLVWERCKKCGKKAEFTDC